MRNSEGYELQGARQGGRESRREGKERSVRAGRLPEQLPRSCELSRSRDCTPDLLQRQEHGAAGEQRDGVTAQ